MTTDTEPRAASPPLHDEHVNAADVGGVRDRCQISAFRVEDVLSSDAVPLNVDAIVLWRMQDGQQASLVFPEGRQAIRRALLASLHEAIGASTLAALLCERADVDEQLRIELQRALAGSGLIVRRVEVRDVAVPAAVEAARDASSLATLYLCRPRQTYSTAVCDGRQTRACAPAKLH